MYFYCLKTKSYLLFLLLVGLGTACKKEKVVEKTIEIEKEYSWKEVKTGLFGINHVILSTGHSADALYFQLPQGYAEFKNGKVINLFDPDLPTDITVRIPITAQYYAYPGFANLSVIVRQNKFAGMPQAQLYMAPKAIDTSFEGIKTNYTDQLPCIAINKNNTVMLAYINSPFKGFAGFMLMGVTDNVPNYPGTDTTFTRVIHIPQLGYIDKTAFMIAIDNYFLVEIYDEGVYKIDENGSYKKVSGPMYISSLYTDKGIIYSLTTLDKVYASADGESWTYIADIPSFMRMSTYYHVGDSVIGTYFDQLFTLNINSQKYSTRPLKFDGLETKKITGIETLNDTVYVATTSGLFMRPLQAFFEKKE